MLKPKNSKFAKIHRGRLTGKVNKSVTLNFGQYGLMATESYWVTSKQIEATRRTITRFIKREGKLWILIFPQKPVSCRVAESRMGAGKGTVSHWVAVVKPGNILFEIAGIEKTLAKNAFLRASVKLPIKTKIIYR